MKKVAPNLYFVRMGRATVKCDFAASSKVSTTSLSGIGSSVKAGETSSKTASTARGARVMVNLRVRPTTEVVSLCGILPGSESVDPRVSGHPREDTARILD